MNPAPCAVRRLPFPQQPIPSRLAVQLTLLLLSAPIIPLVAQIAAPPFAWAKVAGAVNDDYTRASAVDPAGNLYVTGSIDGTATFDATTISSSGGNNRPDIFLAKYDATGNLLWVQRAGGTGTDLAYGIALDSSSNILVTGSSDSVPFAAGTTNISTSGKKIVFLKFNRDGGLLWARTSLAQAFFPPPDGIGTAVGTDAAGNAYFAGQFTGPINFGGTPAIFPPPTGGIAFTNNGDLDIFLLKYSPTGSLLWGRQISGPNLQETRSLAVTPAGDVYLAGRFNGTAEFGGTNLTSGNTSWDTDAFLARWDTTGNLAWVRQIGSNGTDHGLAVTLDAAGAPHMVATFKGMSMTLGTVTLTNSDLTYDLVAAKFNPSGEPQWAMQVERPQTLPDEGLAAAIDPNGNLLVGGAAGTGSKFKQLPLPDGTGGMFLTLIENGDPVWVKRAGGPNNFAGDFATGIGLDASGDIYVAGTLGRNIPDTLTVFDALTPKYYGQRDLFVAKLTGGEPPSTPSLSFSLVGGNLVISWPLGAGDFTLESASALGGTFDPATEPRTTNTLAQTVTVTIPPTGGQQFYRLVRP